MSNVVAVDHQVVNFSQEQVELIKRTICKDSTDDELKLFVHVAKKSKLDPVSIQRVLVCTDIF